MSGVNSLPRAALLALGLSLAFWGTGQAQTGAPDGPYARIEGGWSHVDSISGTGTGGSSLNFDTRENEGFIAGLGGGYKWGRLRLELDLDYSHADIGSVHVSNGGGFAGLTGASTGGTGSIRAITGMVNALYDVPLFQNVLEGRLVPYIGLGIGVARLKLYDLGVRGTTIANSSDWTFAYQPRLGLNYMITDALGLGLEYRYIGTADPSFKDRTGASFDSSYDSHNILLAATYHFGGPAAPPPAPTPAAAPPPPPPPPAAVPAQPSAQPAPLPKQVFIVFFDFDKASLTDAGRQVVAQAAAAYKRDNAPKIELAGYTDLAGSAQYNLALSKRRAETVRDQLVKDGVPADSIDLAWHGKENPRVPTPDGVREPQNRRVEIVMP